MEQDRPVSLDRYGDGALLPVAQLAFDNIVKGTGWAYEGVRQVKDGRFGKVQAILLYLESPDGSRKIDAPLLAKRYTIARGGRPWWSVSKRILTAAGSDIVFTYIDDVKHVYVTDRRAAEEDRGDLRFGDLYFGWYVGDAMSLQEWLRAPGELSIQARLSGP